MQLRMWTYDLAREQTPDLVVLRSLCRLSLESGYNAIGLYLEHRFAYESAPWAQGRHCVTAEMVQTLEREFPTLQIIPFVNLLGHFEGFIYTEEGAQFAEERFKGMQADPTNPDFLALCRSLIDDVLAAFSSEIVHIGGDETAQLGAGKRSAARVAEFGPDVDGKAELYGGHFGPLAAYVSERGRRPAVWGDMFHDHPTALAHLPKETLIFEWQYFRTAEHSAEMFRDAGMEVVLCPAIQTYSAVWCHLPQSERNVCENAEAAVRRGDYGVCVTTWECGLFGNYETLLPAIRASGKILCDAVPGIAQPDDVPRMGLGGAASVRRYAETTTAPEMLAAYGVEGENVSEWAEFVGIRLQEAGGIFAYSDHRSFIKSRLLLYSNPFLLWLRNREDLLGESGDRVFQLLDRSILQAPDSAYRGINEFGKLAIEFVRFAEAARQAYRRGEVGRAVTELSVCRQTFENLERIAKGNQLRFGGSLADISRCRAAKEHVERVIMRVKHYGDGSLGYIPSFETLTSLKFMPHDQGNWWLINHWANE